MTNQNKQSFVSINAFIYVTKSLVRVISVKQCDIICLHGMRPELPLFSWNGRKKLIIGLVDLKKKREIITYCLTFVHGY